MRGPQLCWQWVRLCAVACPSLPFIHFIRAQVEADRDFKRQHARFNQPFADVSEQGAGPPAGSPEPGEDPPEDAQQQEATSAQASSQVCSFSRLQGWGGGGPT